MNSIRPAHKVMVAAAAVLVLASQRSPVSAQRTSGEDVPQFLSLPVHPRPQADGNGADDNYNPNGIYRRGSHFIWQAPLVNGQPPGQTLDNGAAAGPAAPVDAAASNGLFISGSLPVPVSSYATAYHGETGATSIPGLLVAGSNRIYPGSCSTQPCGVLAYESTNGASWTPRPIGMSWKGATFGITFDPALAADNAGNVYYVLGGAPLSGNYPNSIAVAKRSASTGTWSPPVAVTFNSKRYFDDKYWIAVDRSASTYSDRVYVVWDRNTSTNQILYISSSSNGGQTWTAPKKIDDGTSSFERVIGAYATVNQSTGKVYVSWHNYAKNIIYVDQSTNGGVSWGTDVVAATTTTGFGMDIGCNGGRKQGPAHHLIAGPLGTLHLVYANNVSGRGYDIFYKRSTNGGTTWSPAVTLNTDASAAHQYHPTLSVAGAQVTVSFYDRRHDLPSNCSTHVYSTRSLNDGLTWSEDVPITDTASNFNGNANGPGDYSSSTPSDSGEWGFFSHHPAGSTFQIHGANLP